MTTRVLVVNLGPVGTRASHYVQVSTTTPDGKVTATIAKVAPGGYADFYVHSQQSLVIDEKEI